MTHTLLTAAGIALLLLGFVGCVVPALPGPLIGYAALWTLAAGVGTHKLVIGAAAAVAVTVMDYVFPAMFAKRWRCSRLGVFGCMAGTIVGMFFLPLGIVLGPFLGAVAGELVAGRDFRLAFQGGVGALLGFLAGTMVKFAAVTLFAWWFFAAV